MKKHHRFCFILLATDKAALAHLAMSAGGISKAEVTRRLIREAIKTQEIISLCQK
jgi:hypothetical protein